MRASLNLGYVDAAAFENILRLISTGELHGSDFRLFLASDFLQLWTDENKGVSNTSEKARPAYSCRESSANVSGRSPHRKGTEFT